MSDTGERMMTWEEAEKFLGEKFKDYPELKTNLQRFLAFMHKPDALMVMVLNGHLLVEEMLTRIITKFVVHGEFIEAARLTFAQKIQIAKSMSWDEHRNNMWQLPILLNSVRNAYAHELEPEKAAARIENLRAKHNELMSEIKIDADTTKEFVIQAVVVAAMGFLAGFENEVERFRRWVNRLDFVINPHRHKRAQVPGRDISECCGSPE